MRRKIAVCDDEKVMLRQLSQYLTQIQEETGDCYDLCYFTSAEELLEHLPQDVQVILLDISMGEMSGMQCARALRKRGVDCAIMFITSMTQYALEGYDVHAFAFLTKPLVYTELKLRLSDYFARLDHAQGAILSIDTAKGTALLPIKDILYAEVFQHETSIILTDRKITVNIQLSTLEEQLVSRGFFRCHRSYLVSMVHIREIGQETVNMSNGVEVPLSRYRRRAFLEVFSSFMGGRFL